MAFKSEDSGKWKVFMILAATPPAERVSAEQIANTTRVTLGTVETYLKDFCRIIPLHIGYMGKPPLYAFRSEGKTPEEIYGQIKEYYNKRARDSKRKKKDPPAQVDFVVGRPPTPPEEDKKIEGVGYLKNEGVVKDPLMQMVPVTDLEKIASLALQILNPIVAFRMDPMELYANVIREQQRHAQSILDTLRCGFILHGKPIND